MPPPNDLMGAAIAESNWMVHDSDDLSPKIFTTFAAFQEWLPSLSWRQIYRRQWYKRWLQKQTNKQTTSPSVCRDRNDPVNKRWSSVITIARCCADAGLSLVSEQRCSCPQRTAVKWDPSSVLAWFYCFHGLYYEHPPTASSLRAAG